MSMALPEQDELRPGPPGRPHLAHGMGKTLVPADWPPLTDEEVSLVLGGARAGAVVTWHSPRPMSAAGLVSWRGASLAVKRHHVSVRTVGQLAAEHAFAGYLRARGLPVPAVVPLQGGATAVRRGDFSYEAYRLAAGIDLYRDALSWSPFAALPHARSAGAALARLHRAAGGFAAPGRPPGVLISSCAVILATDPVGQVTRILARRPGLARWMARRPWRDDFARHLLPAINRAGPLGRGLPRQWGHGDWHPSNLTWTSAGPDARVAGIFDLGLANRTFAVHDLAIAIERSTVAWLDLAESGQAGADLEAMDALLDGYESVRPLSPAEAIALPGVLPVAHLEFALSEVDYFADVTGSAANAELAYDGYLLGHARWFAAPAGAAVLDHLRRRAGRHGD
jgi:Ser/Thr protein kinase RdoA (MazF antagonist)